MSVAVLREEPFSALFRVTVASGMTAPLGSVIVPRREAVACDCAIEVEMTEAKISTATDFRARLITPPQKQLTPLGHTNASAAGHVFFANFSFQGRTLGHLR